MTDLLALLPEAPAPEPIGRELPIDARFEVWLSRNTEVVQFMARHALRAVRNGQMRLSTKRLFEEARVSAIRTVSGAKDWRLDNTFSAPLARHLMAKYPELDGKFETRRRRS